MDTELIIMLLIVSVLICQAVDGIQMRHIEDKIDELKEEIKVFKSKKD